MNKEQLREKIMEISNSCFPLIDFFNDIGRNKDPRYNKERAYEDIEKIFDVFMYYVKKSEKLEKENRKQLSTILDLDIENRTLKQAFEILKDKKVNVYHILVLENYKQYVEHYPFGEYNAEEDMLDEEECELLKEVLKDD